MNGDDSNARATEKDAAVHYFAYGSNMASTTFLGRRGIACRSAQAARAPGYRLVLDKPAMIDIGQAYANLRADPSAETWGVLYEISTADLAHVDLSEGVLIGNYARVEIDVELVAAPLRRLAAHTLISERRCNLLPSTRYMSLLVEGACEHGLPKHWIDYLRSVPARPEDPADAAWRPILDEALKRR